MWVLTLPYSRILVGIKLMQKKVECCCKTQTCLYASFAIWENTQNCISSSSSYMLALGYSAAQNEYIHSEQLSSLKQATNTHTTHSMLRTFLTCHLLFTKIRDQFSLSLLLTYKQWIIYGDLHHQQIKTSKEFEFGLKTVEQ